MSRARPVLGVIVTYRPDPTSVPGAVAAARREVDELVVVDNASTTASRSLLAGARSTAPGAVGLAPVEVVPNERNEGVSVAFNQALRRADLDRFEAVLLLDQDSIVEPGTVDLLLAERDRLAGRLKVGALQASNREPGGRIPLDARRREYHRRRGKYVGPTSYQGLLFLNSGTLLPTEVFQAVGLFDERYFVDFVDYEFALRLALSGWAVVHVPAAAVTHNVGPSPAPSPVRLYYAVRELTRLLRRYGRALPGGVAPILWTTANRVASSTLRSGRPGAVLRLTLSAGFDGLAGVTGEYRPRGGRSTG